MLSRGLTYLARKWWESEGGDIYWELVRKILRTEIDLVPGLLRAMVETAEPDKISYIGAGPVEDLQMWLKERQRPPTMDLVLEADLAPEELFQVLKGAYASFLIQMGAESRLAGILPEEQITWLLREDVPGRYS
jgi:hypothetical protein